MNNIIRKNTFTPPIFAEIDINDNSNKDGEVNQQTEANGQSVILSTASNVQSIAQPIAPRVHDPIRERFYEMRRLTLEKPYSRNDSELFYRQARFMEDFTDDFDGNAKFNMYFPYYQNMGYDYLRTYFTWRTKVRNGEMTSTSLSYVYLYIYELLSGIGVSDPTDGLNKLLAVWEKFHVEHPSIEKYLSKWLKDYFVFYEMPLSFSDFINEFNMQRFYSLSLLFDKHAQNRLIMWNSVSSYDALNSKFYKDDNAELFIDCFDAVLNKIEEFCDNRNVRFEDLLVYSVSRRTPWQPFKRALFGSRTRQNDREVHISAYERYFCKHGQWTANLPVYYSSQKDFVGYIIKKTEACLRNVVGYKYKLVADIKPNSKPFRELQRLASKRSELDKIIEKAVFDFYADKTRTIVEVDHTNLARIRKEALGIQEQLTVEEDIIEQKVEAAPPIIPDEPLTLSYADGWKALKKALTDVEKKALLIALFDSDRIKEFADENGIMLEVLADSINEKASDYIGDSLIELSDEIQVFDEYRENVEALVG
ncbi:MAG: TerB N-terminal domain-containing protein [Oscillospiraceae bacterium]|jgi:hypothetical protein|nr:TerB N-terminal domain-containing protein [Oscillospiraceae bacterium]